MARTRTRDPRGNFIVGKSHKTTAGPDGSTNRAIRRQSRVIIAADLDEIDEIDEIEGLDEAAYDLLWASR